MADKILYSLAELAPAFGAVGQGAAGAIQEQPENYRDALIQGGLLGAYKLHAQRSGTGNQLAGRLIPPQQQREEEKKEESPARPIRNQEQVVREGYRPIAMHDLNYDSNDEGENDPDSEPEMIQPRRPLQPIPRQNDETSEERDRRIRRDGQIQQQQMREQQQENVRNGALPNQPVQREGVARWQHYLGELDRNQLNLAANGVSAIIQGLTGLRPPRPPRPSTVAQNQEQVAARRKHEIFIPFQDWIPTDPEDPEEKKTAEILKKYKEEKKPERAHCRLYPRLDENGKRVWIEICTGASYEINALNY